MKEKQNIIAIIPARGGSKGIPRKNIKLLCGKPLIAYSIEQALKSNYISRVIVSTEDAEIAQISREYGSEVIERPVELARDDTPSLPVIKHVITYLETNEGYKAEIIVVLQPTSPLRTVEDIEKTIDKLFQSGCDSVVSLCEVEHPPEWMYILVSDRIEPLLKEDRKIYRRQDMQKTYRLNGAVYVTHNENVTKKNVIMGQDTRAIIMPPERSIDIDSDYDFIIAECLMHKRN